MGRITTFFYDDDRRIKNIKLKRANRQELTYPICPLYSLEVTITHNKPRQQTPSENNKSNLIKSIPIKCSESEE